MANRGRENRGSGGDQVSPPRYPETTPPPQPSGDYTYTLEIVMRMQETMGRLTEAVDGLKKEQSEQRAKLDTIGKQIYAAIAAIALVGAVLTYFNSTINNIATKQLIPSATQQQQPSPLPSPSASPSIQKTR